MLNPALLKDAERIARVTMIVILLTAGTSKLFSGGGFFDYYSELFRGDLRINVAPWLVDAYLTIIPFIEISLGLALVSTRHKWLSVHAWTAFMLSLTVGHYILQEWSAVNQMLAYLFLGMLCLVLPHHESWLRRDPE